jgi:hypothetical protein
MPTPRKVFGLLSDQGTAASETALCERHRTEASEAVARSQAHADVPVDAEFVDVTSNVMMFCIVCDCNGYGYKGDPEEDEDEIDAGRQYIAPPQ